MSTSRGFGKAPQDVEKRDRNGHPKRLTAMALE
jgi:hypothetical protein